jgi:hypothetical protein
MASREEDDMPERPWFKPRRYGIGLTPISWQGWTITAAYFFVVVLLAVTLAHQQPWIFVTLIALSTVVYYLVAMLTRGGR